MTCGVARVAAIVAVATGHVHTSQHLALLTACAAACSCTLGQPLYKKNWRKMLWN